MWETAPRACAWPPRPQRTEGVRLLTAEEIRAWTLFEDEGLLVLNKDGGVVVHPSKAGPWSSLVGAVREVTGLETLHLVFRLDRETSGVIVIAKNPVVASRLQRAVQERRVRKTYLVLLVGDLAGPVTVDQPLGPDLHSPVFVKSTVTDGPGSQRAVSHFEPVKRGGGFTLARVRLETGRKHQIRAHARWLGCWVVGDKIYGPDERWYLEFIERGYTPAMAEAVLLPRQALHCAEILFEGPGMPGPFSAPLPADLQRFLEERVGEG